MGNFGNSYINKAILAKFSLALLYVYFHVKTERQNWIHHMRDFLL